MVAPPARADRAAAPRGASVTPQTVPKVIGIRARGRTWPRCYLRRV